MFPVLQLATMDSDGYEVMTIKYHKYLSSGKLITLSPTKFLVPPP